MAQKVRLLLVRRNTLAHFTGRPPRPRTPRGGDKFRRSSQGELSLWLVCGPVKHPHAKGPRTIALYEGTSVAARETPHADCTVNSHGRHIRLVVHGEHDRKRSEHRHMQRDGDGGLVSEVFLTSFVFEGFCRLIVEDARRKELLGCCPLVVLEPDALQTDWVDEIFLHAFFYIRTNKRQVLRGCVEEDSRTAPTSPQCGKAVTGTAVSASQREL